MTETNDNNRILFHVILGLAVLILSFIVTREGSFVDETGLLSVYKSIYQGNRLFVDSWGALPIGGLLTYPLFALYYEVLEPIIYPMGIGFVLYARICYQIVRFLIAVYLYATIKKTEYERGAFITALAYYTMFVSYKNFSYKSMCDFGIILFICWLWRYFETNNKWFFILMGLATCVTILAYPTMILFPFFIVVGMLIVMFKDGAELLKPIIIYSITCLVIGVVVVIYLQITVGWSNILSQLVYLEDSAFKNPAYIRLGKMLLEYVVFFVIAYLPIVVLKIFSFRQEIEESTIYSVLSIYWLVYMAAVIFARPASVSDSRMIYGFLVIMWWLPYLLADKEKSRYTRVGHYKIQEHSGKQVIKAVFAISLLTQFIWSISTNQGITVPGYMSMYIVLMVLLLAASELEGLMILEAGIVVCCLFFSLVWVTEGDGGYSDIFQSRFFVEEGAYKGIALNEEEYNNNKACYNLVTNYLTAEDKLFIPYGYCYTAYLNSDAKQGVGSPYSRPGKGQLRVLEYWEVNPENQANFVMLNPQNKYYSEFVGGETEEYINENYKTTVATEGDFILLAR